MRDIKFRAWKKKEKRMFSVMNLYFEDIGQCVDEELNRRRHFLSDIKLMQYTGLKDKNGKEIYEGDIMLHGSLMYPVVFDKLGWRLIRMTLKGHRINTYIDVKKDKVIGNIYDTPSLLIEKKDL